MTAPTPGLSGEALADLSAVIRDYLLKETDVTRPSFHATALTTRLAPLLAQSVRDGQAEAWDECVKALAWCLDNGHPESAVGYLVETNPYRARAAGVRGEEGAG